MYRVTSIYKGKGYDQNVRLIKRVYDSGRVSWEFRDRFDRVGNPTDADAKKIIKDWRLEEVSI